MKEQQMKRIMTYKGEGVESSVWLEKDSQGTRYYVKASNGDETMCEILEDAHTLANSYIERGEDSTVVDSGSITVFPIDKHK